MKRIIFQERKTGVQERKIDVQEGKPVSKKRIKMEVKLLYKKPSGLALK